MNRDSPLAQFKYIFLVFAGLVSMGPLAMDMYLPAFPTIAAYLSIDIADVQYTLVAFLLGSTLGQFLGGPLSDAVGRLRVALLGCLLFAATSVLISTTHAQGTFLAARALQGFAAGSGAVVVSALIVENYEGTAAARMMLSVTLVMLGVPLLAPLIGTGLLKLFGWKAIFIFLAGIGVVMTFAVKLNSPKQRLRPVSKEKRNLLIGIRNMFRNYGAVLAKPTGRLYLIGMGMNISVYMVFATSASFAYMEYLGASLELFPFLLGANTISLIFGNRLGSYLLRTYEPSQVCVMGSTAMAISCAILVGYLLAFEPKLHAVVILIFIIAGAIPMSGPISSSIFMQLYDKNAGTASASMGVSRVLFCMLGAFAVTWLHNDTLLPMALLMLIIALMATFSFRLGRKRLINTYASSTKKVDVQSK